MAVIVNISLDHETDKDILRWLGSQSNKSAAVRDAIRSYMAREDGVTLADVLAEIRSLPSRLHVVAAGSEPTTDSGIEEPTAAAANLNGLLDRLGNGDFG